MGAASATYLVPLKGRSHSLGCWRLRARAARSCNKAQNEAVPPGRAIPCRLSVADRVETDPILESLSSSYDRMPRLAVAAS